MLVFNNSRGEMQHTFQPQSQFTDLDEWGFIPMAAGMGGGAGVRVRKRAELKAALDHAIRTRGKFQLIGIIYSRGVLSEALQRFVAGVKRLTAK